MRPKTILAAIMAVGGLLAVTHPASAAAFAFTTIDVPGAVPGSTQAGGINNSGQIVGSFDAGGTTHGFLDTGGSFTTIDVPGSSFTIANGINDARQIVGTFESGFAVEHGFLATPVSMVPEPSSLALFSIGLIALRIVRRR